MKKNSLDKIAYRIMELLTDNEIHYFQVDFCNMGFTFYPKNNHIKSSAKDIENEINSLLREFIAEKSKNLISN